ncbi:MAG: hypothetical protein AAB462_03570 [Patescibacteria group bacterium]
MKIAVITLAIVVAVVSANQSEALAQPTSQVTIVPFLQTVRVESNEPTKTVDLTITNRSSKTQNFHLNVLNFGTLNETGGLVFSGNNASTLAKKYGLATWLRLSVSDLVLEPTQSSTVQATIINDVSLTPGGHYGAVVASVNTKDDVGGNKVNVKQELSSLIFATKVGGEKYDLSLKGVKYDVGWGQLPSQITLRFKNTGNVQVVPRGIVKIVSPRGNVVSQGVINEASSYVLPETYRQLPVSLKSVAKEGIWPKFYRLDVYYRYDGINSFTAKSYTLYLVNWAAIVAFIATTALIVFIIFKAWKYEMHRRSRPKPVPKVVYKKQVAKRATEKPKKKSKKSPKLKGKKQTK